MTSSKILKSIAILSFVLLYLINVLVDHNLLNTLMTFIIISLLIINIPLLKGPSKYISLALFSIGIILMFKYQATILEWQVGLIKNAGIITLLVTVPMLGFPLFYEDFQQAIMKISKKHLNTPVSFYSITTILSFCLGILLNIASMSIVSHLLNETKKQYSNNLFSSALTRGIMGCSIWSPSFVGVAVVLHYTELPWIKIAPFGILLALISLILSIKYEQYHFKDYQKIKTLTQSETKISKETSKILKRLMILGISLIFTIVFLELLTGLSVLVVVPLVSLLGPFFIALIWGKLPVFYDSFKNYANNKLPNMKNEIVLFTAAGFFGHSLNIAKIGDYISEVIYYLNIQQSYLLIAILMAIIIVFALIGVHPVITVSTILITLPVSKIPLMPIQFTLTILISYSIATLLSPISGTVLVASGILKENPFNIGLFWNWQYALILIIIYITILSVIPF